jgi:hypothetical protein
MPDGTLGPCENEKEQIFSGDASAGSGSSYGAGSQLQFSSNFGTQRFGGGGSEGGPGDDGGGGGGGGGGGDVTTSGLPDWAVSTLTGAGSAVGIAGLGYGVKKYRKWRRRNPTDNPVVRGTDAVLNIFAPNQMRAELSPDTPRNQSLLGRVRTYFGGNNQVAPELSPPPGYRTVDPEVGGRGRSDSSLTTQSMDRRFGDTTASRGRSDSSLTTQSMDRRFGNTTASARQDGPIDPRSPSTRGQPDLYTTPTRVGRGDADSFYSANSSVEGSFQSARRGSVRSDPDLMTFSPSPNRNLPTTPLTRENLAALDRQPEVRRARSVAGQRGPTGAGRARPSTNPFSPTYAQQNVVRLAELNPLNQANATPQRFINRTTRPASNVASSSSSEVGTITSSSSSQRSRGSRRSQASSRTSQASRSPSWATTSSARSSGSSAGRRSTPGSARSGSAGRRGRPKIPKTPLGAAVQVVRRGSKRRQDRRRRR